MEQLLASFREQGLLVAQEHLSPDFEIQNRLGGKATVETVTANPSTPYDHMNARLARTQQSVMKFFWELPQCVSPTRCAVNFNEVTCHIPEGDMAVF
jgi:hypothetical protein